MFASAHEALLFMVYNTIIGEENVWQKMEDK